MNFKRCYRVIFAAAVLLAGLIASPAAYAHAAHTGNQESRIPEQAKTGGVELRAAVMVSPPDPSSQCAAQMCCGSVCFAGGYVLKGETLVMPLPTSGSVFFPTNSPPGRGIAPEGLRRPPRA